MRWPCPQIQNLGQQSITHSPGNASHCTHSDLLLSRDAYNSDAGILPILLFPVFPQVQALPSFVIVSRLTYLEVTYFPQDIIKLLIYSLIISCIDCPVILLASLPASMLYIFFSILSCKTWCLFDIFCFDHITSLSHSLHWCFLFLSLFSISWISFHTCPHGLAPLHFLQGQIT